MTKSSKRQQPGGSVFAQQTDGRMHSGTGHRFGFAKHAATQLRSERTVLPGPLRRDFVASPVPMMLDSLAETHG